MHREIEAMKEAVAGYREVALELEEHPGMVELGIRLEKILDLLGMLFFIYDFRSGTYTNYCSR